jgi:hypothetical protein
MLENVDINEPQYAHRASLYNLVPGIVPKYLSITSNT